MPDIEFHDVIGQIEQTSERIEQSRDAEDPLGSPEKLKRLIRVERERTALLAERLKP